MDKKFHGWLTSIIERPGDKMIIVPRFHLKSTWVKLRLVQLILIDPNVRILLVSATSRLVEKHLKWIKRILSNPKLRALFPKQLPDPGRAFKGWEKSSANELIVWRDPKQEHAPDAPQILAVGAEAEITGFHFDYAFLDDIVTDENVKTQSQLLKIEDWWEYLQPILEADAEITITGTPYHYRDLYARVRGRKEIALENIYHRKNIEGGKIIYSSWWTHKDFEKQKRLMRPYKYSCQWECNAVPDEDRIFPPPQPTFQMPLPQDERGYRYYCLIDPAATEEEYSDKTAMVIIAVNHINQVFVIESVSSKTKGDETADRLIQRHLRYSFKKIGIELGLQTHLETIIKMRISDFERETGRKLKMTIQPIPIKKIDKATRIDRMIGSLVRTGKILINEQLTTLIGQMDNFTGKKGDEDDEIDALSMCPYVVESFAAHNEIDGHLRREGNSWRDWHNKKKKGGGYYADQKTA